MSMMQEQAVPPGPVAGPLPAADLAVLARGQRLIGEAAVARGDLPAALRAMRGELDLLRRLSALDQSDRGRRAAVDRAAARVADVLVLRSAIASVGRGTPQSPGASPRAASWTLGAAARELEAHGDLNGALALHREGLAIRRRLVAEEPDNVACALDLSFSLAGLGATLAERGDLAGALESHRDALAIRRALADRDPANAGLRLDMSWNLAAIADILTAQGEHAAALDASRESLAIRRARLATDAGNDGLRCDVAASLTRIADLLSEQGDRAGALAAYQEARNIAHALHDRDPDSATRRDDVAAIDARIADLDAAEMAPTELDSRS